MRTIDTIPKIMKMAVYPVAGYDSMTLTLSGAHAPYFTRNIVVLEDETGQRGVGEIHGGEDITKMLESYIPLVEGQKIADYRQVITTIRKKGWLAKGNDGQGLQGLDLKNMKFVVQAEAAVECAMLDLLGKHLNMPMCTLLGDGRQRAEVEVLGYLFYIADCEKTDLPYLVESSCKDKWDELRRKETLTPEEIVAQAKAVKERYGFNNFKLKGGVFSGEAEMKAIEALHDAFPDARINIDPNGAWSLEEAIDLCKDKLSMISYVEDPCGPEQGFSSREIMSEFKTATRHQVATNMIATNWRQFYHALETKAVDIVLADPHFWTLNGSIRMAQILADFGLTWGSHSNNHFDISLAVFAQCAAAALGKITPIDTHWIWQDGQALCKDPLVIRDGKIKVTDKPGLGIEIDMEKLESAHHLYQKIEKKYRDRDDSLAMQYLIKGWMFDSSRPCLVR